MTGAERVAKNYEKNKESILAKRRAKYHDKKLAKVELIEEPLKNTSELIELIELPLKNTSELVEIVEPVEPVEEELIHPVNVLEIITKNINSLEGETEATKKLRISNMKTIINILNPINYKEFIKALKTRPVNTIKQIKLFQYRPNKVYAPNTLITLYKAVLFYFDNFNINVKTNKKEKYKDAVELYDAIAVVELKEKNKSIIPTFKEYLQEVLNEYGLNSREYLIVKLYQQVKCRDDLLLIVANASTPLDKLTNYLVVGEIFRVVLNDYKTIDRYGVVDVKLDAELTNLLQHYIENHNIQVGDCLFNSNNISMIVSRMNKRLGFTGHGSINLIRKLLSTDANLLPLQEQLKVSKQLCHSLKVTNSNYVVKE